MMKKLFILIVLSTPLFCFGQNNLRNLLPGVWQLDSIYENGEKRDHSIYLQTIEFTLNGRIFLGIGVYNYYIQGDSVIFDYGDNNIRKLLGVTKQNLVLYDKAYADLYDKTKSDGYLWTTIYYYSRTMKKQE